MNYGMLEEYAINIRMSGNLEMKDSVGEDNVEDFLVVA
jgi:hypothetical protein